MSVNTIAKATTTNFNIEYFNIIYEILNQTQSYPLEIVEIALNAQIGNFEYKCLYNIVDYDGLESIAKELENCKDEILAIQINDTQFAIPYMIIDDVVYLFDVYYCNKNGHKFINYNLINGIHRDLNNFLKIYNIPVNFKGIKRINKGIIYKVPKFSCNLKHKKLNIDSLINLINQLFNYKMNDELDFNPKLEAIIANTEWENPEDDDSKTFIEYVDYVYKKTGHYLLSIPDFYQLN